MHLSKSVHVASAKEPTPEISENSLALDNTGILLHYIDKGDLAEDTILDRSLLGDEASPLVDVDASNYHYYAQNNKSATVINSVTLDQESPHNFENLLSEPAKKSVAMYSHQKGIAKLASTPGLRRVHMSFLNNEFVSILLVVWGRIQHSSPTSLK